MENRIRQMFVNHEILRKTVHRLTCLTAIVVSVLSLINVFGSYPYLELSTHFMLQYAWLSLICIIALCSYRSWKLILLVAAIFFFNTSQIIPYYYAAQPQAKNLPAVNVRVMLANVQGNNKDCPSLIEAVRFINPDILVLQEVTADWWEKIEVLTANYSYYKSVPRAGGSGLTLFSRYPIEKADVLTLDASTHPALFSQINLEGTRLSLLTFHPPTPMRRDKFDYRNGQFSQAAEIMKTSAEPKMVIGDLNTTMWSPYFQTLIKDSGLKDGRIGKGLHPSWNAALPAFLRIPIDHCLVGEKIEVENIEVGDYTGSDHRPLIIDVRVEKQAINQAGK